MYRAGRQDAATAAIKPLLLATTFVAFIAVVYIRSADAQLAPDRALKMLKPADGLEVTLFASEDDLVNPTAMDVDAQGRVWVTEAVNYRLFKNPKRRPEGDRIRVLEDTNGDGRCDRATTFYQDPSLQAPLGIAVLGSRVYVTQSPDLFYLEDTDGDGRADKKTVVLTGFKGVDHDHALHGIMFGPDGYLYMTVGDQGLDVTDKQGNRVQVGANASHAAASVLRTDLEGRHLELLAEGFRNPYEPAVDAFGNVFISDNDDDGNEQCRIAYVMPGGNYGYWPRRSGDRRLGAVHWNEDMPGVLPKILKTGFGSPAGMVFYEGTLLPERYRNGLIHADAGPGVIRAYPLRPKGAAYETEIRTLLSAPGDKWFRPVDVAVAPDGAIFVADWYDPGVGGHNMGDHRRGRIYRIAPPRTPPRVPKLDVSSPAGAARALASPNQATRFLAFRALDADRSEAALQALESLFDRREATVRARALWLLASRGAHGEQAVLKAAHDPRPEFRVQAVRILAGQGPEALRRVETLLDDPDPAVRREILVSLRHVKADWRHDWIMKLARSFDGQDPFYRGALGIAMRGEEDRYFSEIAREMAGKWDKRFAEIAFELHSPEAVTMAARTLSDTKQPLEVRLDALRIVGAGGGDSAARTIIDQLQAGAPAPLLTAALERLGRDEGRAWPQARRNPHLLDFMKNALAAPDLRGAAEKLIRGMRMVEFLPHLVETAKNPRNPSATRVAAIDTIRTLQSPDALASLKSLLADADPPVATAALRALANLPGDEAQQALQGLLLEASRPKALRLEAVRLLGASSSGALVLLDLADKGKLSQDLILPVTEVTHTSRHERVRRMAEKALPRPQSRTGKPLPPIATLARMRGNAERGRALFFGSEGPQCARCHKINGVGRDVGPDLSKIGTKLARDSILESILNPSAAIAHEYQVWIVRTKSKGLRDGYIRNESAEAIELVDSNGDVTRVPTGEILERRKSPISLMPSGLSEGMTAQQLVDVTAFLSSLK